MKEFENRIKVIYTYLSNNTSSQQLQKYIIEIETLIKENTSYHFAFFVLAIAYWKILNLEKAIFNFKKCLEIDPDFELGKSHLLKAKKEKIDLVTYLTYKNPKIFSTNSIIKCHQRLQSIKNEVNINKKITTEYIVKIFNQIHSILSEENIDTDIEISQIHRESKLKYDKCLRHFEVFNTFNVIPKNCFDCYKIQILPRNVIELIKLYVVFDNLNSKINLTRKCMVEFRENIKEPYKGFIYCVGIEEAKNTLKLLSPILDKSISKEVPRLIKRGCSEFAMSFPKFKEINSNHKDFMSYDEDWLVKENIIDEKLSRNPKEHVIEDTSLQGIGIKDAIILYNWLYYAKKIGDQNYKIICSNPNYSNYIEGKLTENIIEGLKLN